MVLICEKLPKFLSNIYIAGNTNSMRLKKLLPIVFISILLQSVSTQSQCQDIDINKFISHPWVDSVYKSLSIADRISQVFILNNYENSVDSIDYGGIILATKDPVNHRQMVNSLENDLVVPAFVFSYLNDAYGLQLDDVFSFATPTTLAAISEPHLLYETGLAIAKQCNLLGINGLISEKEGLLLQASQESWRLSEINQGFVNQKVLPLGFVKFYQAKDFNLNIMLDSDQPMMMVIDSDSVLEIHRSIHKAIINDQTLMNQLNENCRKILALKYWAGLDNVEKVNISNLKDELNSIESKLLKHELASASLTVLKNNIGLLPISQLENKKIACLTIGKDSNLIFEDYLNHYTRVDQYYTDYNNSENTYSELWSKLNSYDIIIAGLYESDFLQGNVDGEAEFTTFMNWLNNSGKGMITFFGDPALLHNASGILNAPVLVLAYEDNQLTNALAAQLIFGGIDAAGVLPQDIDEIHKKGYGIPVRGLGRFSYLLPEEAGLNSRILNKIDSVASYAIHIKAAPGCQVLIAKDNKVVYKKSFGYHTYDSLHKVTDSDLYDLASVTKVSGALPGLMKLYEEGRFDLDATLGTYLKYFKRSNKKELTFREILAHQSGIKPYIVYWKTAIKKSGKYRRKTISITQSADYPYEISNGLFIHKDYKKKIYKQIKKTKLGEKKYKYSGLTFYLFPDIIESITGEQYTDYIYNNFYKPLGATTLTYNPTKKFDSERIVPTEYDSLFRKQLIHGKVHDEGAAMMGGVSSNAGLFADANDLAKLFQMYCNYGKFGGKEYLKEETIKEFSRCQYPENDNRRGLGFDRPLPEPHENGNTAKSVSQSSFGHSGFTGTFAWADPEYNIVYIFLSNRVYPTRENRKLYELNIRTNIQEIIYEALEK